MLDDGDLVEVGRRRMKQVAAKAVAENSPPSSVRGERSSARHREVVSPGGPIRPRNTPAYRPQRKVAKPISATATSPGARGVAITAS